MVKRISPQHIRALPKVELHVHAEAIVTYATYHELNQKNKVNEALKTEEDFTKLFDIKSLRDMIKNFLFLQTLFRHADDFRYVVGDVEKYCADNNIQYIELHVSPTMVLREGYVPFDDFMGVLVDGFEELAARGGPDVRIIMDLSRTFGVKNAAANLTHLKSFLAKKPNTRVLGVGLGGQEIGNPCKDFADIMADAKAAGLHVVVHAGEEVGSESIWDALRVVGAERIGHGTSAMFDEALINYLRLKKVPLEICPTSNVITGKYVQSIKDHPLINFIKKGIVVTVNTDDPVLFDVDLNRELQKVADAFDLDLESVASLLRNSIEASFNDAESKKRLKKNLDDSVGKLAALPE